MNTTDFSDLRSPTSAPIVYVDQAVVFGRPNEAFLELMPLEESTLQEISFVCLVWGVELGKTP